MLTPDVRIFLMTRIRSLPHRSHLRFTWLNARRADVAYWRRRNAQLLIDGAFGRRAIPSRVDGKHGHLLAAGTHCAIWLAVSKSTKPQLRVITSCDAPRSRS